MFKKAFEWVKNAFAFIKSRLSVKAVVIILSSVVGVVGLVTGGVTLARYVQEHGNDMAIAPSRFYFDSNLLKVASANAEYYNATNSISFELVNFDDSYRKSEVDINYEVTIRRADGSSVSATGTNTSGVISAAGEGRALVTYTGLDYETTYVITARSTKPYVKELSATFVIPREDNAISPVITDNGDYVTIMIKTNNFAGNVTLSWQYGYVPDNSYAPLANASGTSCTVTLESKSTYVFRFFKSKLSATYDANSFIVTG